MVTDRRKWKEIVRQAKVTAGCSGVEGEAEAEEEVEEVEVEEEVE
jgi:hypothetical protein